MKRIRPFLYMLMNLGVEPGTPPADLIRRRLVNVIHLTGAFIYLLYMLGALLVGIKDLVLPNLVGVLLFIVVLVLNKVRPLIAAPFSLLAFNLLYVWISLIFGHESGMEYVMLLLGIIPFMYFNRIWLILSFALFSALSFFFIHWWLASHPPLSDFQSEVFYILNMLSLMLVFFLFLLYFKLEYFRYQRITRVQNEALREKNTELDRFAYVTAHDLKSPLRGIRNLLGFIKEDFPEVWDGEPGEYLEKIGSQSRRMENLIEGILAYSRIDRMEEVEEALDLSELAAGLPRFFPNRGGIRIKWDAEMPVIRFHPVKLQQVLLNLVGNAIRYHDRENGRVHISAEKKEDGTVVIRVADDGPGIAPEFHDRVFGFFETLQPKSETGTAGLGLTIVKKIITDAGGQVWIQSEPGEGATFYISLPDRGEAYPR